MAETVRPIADSHCHFFSRTFFEGLARLRGDAGDDQPAAMTALLGWETPGEPERLADRWVAELDRHHVSRAALIASAPGDEASVAAAIAHRPDRFVGFFFVDPTMPDAVERVGATLALPGMRTACLLPAMHRYALTDERVARVGAVVAAQPGAALFVHCGMLSVGVRKRLGIASAFEMRFGNPLDLQALALRHPSLPVILPHFGAGLFREALMLADACPNVYLDTSSSNGWIRYHPGLTLVDVFAHALQVVGPERLLFGTDSSYFPRGWHAAIFEQQRYTLRTLGAGDHVTANIFGGNFNRLFPAG